MILYTSVQVKSLNLIEARKYKSKQKQSYGPCEHFKTSWIPNKNSKHDKMDSLKKSLEFKS
jgi:CRISPR/Cas system CMR-associated protein Cmr5 small subunit